MSLPSDPRDFCRLWFDRSGYTMLPSGRYEGATAVDFDRLFLEYQNLYVGALRMAKMNDTPKPVKISEDNMKKGWNVFLHDARIEALDKIRTELQYKDGVSDQALKLWLQGLTGKVTDFEVTVMKHVLWQIKRKLFNRSVVYHLCPIFWGEQDGGKSTGLKRLLKPLEALTIEWAADQSVDSRNTQALADNYVCFQDEMANLEKVQIEALKRIITADSTDYRPLYSNRLIRARQNCTLIGVSNKSLIESLYDSTGLRRFVEIRCLTTLNWEIINAVQTLEIWQNIDESLERGYIEPMREQLKEHQKDMLVLDEISHFVRENEIAPMEGGVTLEITATELWRAYSEWRLQNGYSSRPTLILTSFCLKLRTHNLHKREKKVEGKLKVLYTVNAASHIFETKKVFIAKDSGIEGKLKWNQ